MVKPFSRYSTLKNRAIWLDEPFLAIFGQMHFFLKNRAPSVLYHYGSLTSCQKSEKTNEAILRKIPKTSFLARFGPFWPKNGQMDFFLKNRAPSVSSLYGPLTSCKKSEKTNEPILSKCVTDGLTDRLTDRSNFIGPLNLRSSGPKSEKFNDSIFLKVRKT